MEKREFDKQKTRNANIVNDIINIETNTENLTDEMDVVTEKQFSEFVSETEKISSKGKRSQKTKAKVSKKDLEAAKKDVSSELEKAYDTFNRLNDIARKYNLQGTELEEDDFVLNTQKKVYELYEELKKRPLTTEEFSDLVELTRQMNFNELVRNYVDAGRAVMRDRIEKLEKEENNKTFVIFKPIVTKFKEKFKSFKEDTLNKVFENPEISVKNTDEQTKMISSEYNDYINDVNEELFKLLLEDNFEENLNKEFSLQELDNLLKVTDDLKAKYDEVNLPTEDGFYPIENISERDVRWGEYAGSLMDSIGELQAMHLKNCYSDIRKYAVKKSSSGTILCQIGTDYIPVSKQHLVDDIALFYSKMEEHENSLKNVNTSEDIFIPPMGKSEQIIDENSEEIMNEFSEDTPQMAPLETKPIEVIEQPEEDIQIDVPLVEDEIEIPVAETSEIDSAQIEEKSEEDIIVPPIVEEPVDVNSIESEDAEEISPSKQAYIEVMSCFVDREEAISLATEDNVNQFEASNLGYGKYIEAINSGMIDNNTSYENFVVEQIQKDNGIKYDDLEEEIDNYKDDSGLDVIVSEENPIISENVETDLSGIDKMVSNEDPLAFSDNTPSLGRTR